MSKTHLFADMTFIHEGNHTLVENLINFEKMVSSRGVVVCQWSGLGDMTMALEGGEGWRQSQVINYRNGNTYFNITPALLHCTGRPGLHRGVTALTMSPFYESPSQASSAKPFLASVLSITRSLLGFCMCWGKADMTPPLTIS